MGDRSDPPPSKIAHVDRFPPVTSEQKELAKKFNYDEYEVVYGLSNELSMKSVRYI